MRDVNLILVLETEKNERSHWDEAETFYSKMS